MRIHRLVCLVILHDKRTFTWTRAATEAEIINGHPGRLAAQSSELGSLGCRKGATSGSNPKIWLTTEARERPTLSVGFVPSARNNMLKVPTLTADTNGTDAHPGMLHMD